MTPHLTIRDKENLEQQYDEVIKYLDGYRVFQASLRNELFQFMWRHPGKYLLLVKQLPAGWRQINMLSERNTEFDKSVMLEVATKDRKRSEYYSILSSDYPLHELSMSLERQFPDVDFDKLKKLHESKGSQLSGFNVQQIIGIVFAAATVLLKSMPESVVARVVDYKRFELITFLTASGVTIYLLAILLPFWVKQSRARRLHEFAKRVLEYVCIRKPSVTPSNG